MCLVRSPANVKLVELLEKFAGSCKLLGIMLHAKGRYMESSEADGTSSRLSVIRCSFTA